MESIALFATLVVGFCALDLIWKLSAYVGRTAAGKRRVNSDRKPVQRSDWYMFFHCSDLTGEKTTVIKDARISKRSDPAVKSGRQPTSRRPELRRYVS
ncbi:MAG: hypothetical protein IH612_04155 [Desulfofustis sp.]|nr:hypothetical protein [Desulfofustis sp.]